MTSLVLGATGATGRLLVSELLRRGQKVKAVARTPSTLGEERLRDPNLSVVQASISEMSERDIADLVSGCDAAASCLGHNLTFKGLFAPPRRLVTDATRRICQALQEGERDRPAKFVLMNTTGNSNRDLAEEISLAQRGVILLLRLLLPPHVDNEQAADFLRVEVGQQDPRLEWAAVRPDGLVDAEAASEYSLYPSPIRSAIFDAGTTSRVNVAHFMADLITDPEVWTSWKGQMPVIYNQSAAEADPK
jgi:NAD(P)-dependent dehydrogenase (short-subunit alcohol dehydrogenase family)